MINDTFKTIEETEKIEITFKNENGEFITEILTGRELEDYKMKLQSQWSSK